MLAMIILKKINACSYMLLQTLKCTQVYEDLLVQKINNSSN